MSILIVAKNKDLEPWIKEFLKKDKTLSIEIYPNIKDKDKITMVLMWSKSDINFKEYKNLKCISSMGAGVNHILENTSINKDVAITKIVDKNLINSMWEYLLTCTMNVVTNQYKYINQKQTKLWKQQSSKPISEYTIGIMGLGQLGKNTAINFEKIGFKVKGYSNTRKCIDNIKCYNKKEKNEFKKDIDILINLMPLTKINYEIFNLEFFKTLKKGCYFINVGRGEHIKDDDLIIALEQNMLSVATLDVFRTEPLEKHHPFWDNDKIIITPHSASITNPVSVINQILNNYKKLNKNEELLHQIDKTKGY